MQQSNTVYTINDQNPSIFLSQQFILQVYYGKTQSQLLKQLLKELPTKVHIPPMVSNILLKVLLMSFAVVVVVFWMIYWCFPEPPTKATEAVIMRSPPSNTRKPADKNLGPMLPITKQILRDFYRPFNEKLAKVLDNDSYLWENDPQLWTAPPPFLLQ